MVESIKSIAARVGATCYADPFLPATDDGAPGRNMRRGLTRLVAPIRQQLRQLAADDPQHSAVMAYPGARDR
jgi:3-phenylpropionate/trans-cinnamate dioxygenase ferredoxin reductase subunit